MKASPLKLLLAALAAVLPIWAGTHKNDVATRLQWNQNSGYCGEVSLISAGLYYGQYISQYDVREVAGKNAPQNETQLLLGVNDQYAASQMHLNAVAWDTAKEKNTHQFLQWVKQNVIQGYPVAIGVFTNEYLFYGHLDPSAGDDAYDHIVCVTGISSNRSLTNPNYYGSDTLHFSDHGFWTDDAVPCYHFRYKFSPFQADRQEANAKNGPIYSLSDSGSNYGIAITGIMDLNGDTLPLRVDTQVNSEMPEIEEQSNIRPSPMPLLLTLTASQLEPGVSYILYRYNTLESVPDSDFNAHASQAFQSWQIHIDSGSTYVTTQEISSNEIAVYRLVKASAP